jgi:predicted nucleic acid-binding protein
VRAVLVDTGAWIALVVRQDECHQIAASHARRLARVLTPLLTTNYILLETYTYIRYHYGHHKALELDTVLQTLIRAGRLIVVWVTEEVHVRALDIFRKYEDQTFSVVDCASFIVARDRKIRDVFGFDKNFLTMGFVLRPARSVQGRLPA